MTKIVEAAIRLEDGRILTGHRHSDIIYHPDNKELAEQGWFKRSKSEQGFVDEDGNFWNRYQAGCRAYRMGQTKTRILNLLSEHLY